MPKKDLVITAIRGYQWEDIRPFVLSLEATTFSGDKVALAAEISPFTHDCLVNRGWTVIPFKVPANSYKWEFITRDRFIPLLDFLKIHAKEYRYILWMDSGDQIFQTNPSDWFTKYAAPHNIICAREGWLIKDETTWNDAWVQHGYPEEYDWLREYEVLCSGTIAGDPATMLDVMGQIYLMSRERISSADQASLNYIIRKPFPVSSIIPDLNDGWCATLSSVITENFRSCCGFPKEKIAIAPPVFDLEHGLVLTPDGRKPFVLVHQYNRDGRWTQIMRTKYREW